MRKQNPERRCGTCDGRAEIFGEGTTMRCPTCNGTGEVKPDTEAELQESDLREDETGGQGHA